jgi:hypothetical protein
MPKPRGSKARDLALGTPLVVNLDRQIMGVLTAALAPRKLLLVWYAPPLASGPLLNVESQLRAYGRGVKSLR